MHFWRAPDSNLNRVFYFCDDRKRDAARQIRPANYQQHDKILSWPELERLGRVFRGLGIQKVRVTGGEPLVRPGVENFIARMSETGFPDLSMTTNGHQLAEHCDRLIAAGLKRIKISLDSLNT